MHIDDEVNSRLAKASAAFGRLRPTVWERSGISLATKLKVYKAVVITTLLYACETWTVYRRHARKLQHFHTTSLRRILNIRWQDKVPDTEVRERANQPSIYTLLQKCQLRWAGHVYRMPDHRIPKQLLYGELASGKRSVGGQRKRFNDSLKTSLKAMNIDWESWESWESHALDRPHWLHLVSTGSKTSEQSRLAAAREKRATRKCSTCGRCGRYFRARIGLVSHLRTHRNQSTT